MNNEIILHQVKTSPLELTTSKAVSCQIQSVTGTGTKTTIRNVAWCSGMKWWSIKCQNTFVESREFRLVFSKNQRNGRSISFDLKYRSPVCFACLVDLLWKCVALAPFLLGKSLSKHPRWYLLCSFHAQHSCTKSKLDNSAINYVLWSSR